MKAFEKYLYFYSFSADLLFRLSSKWNRFFQSKSSYPQACEIVFHSRVNTAELLTVRLRLGSCQKNDDSPLSFSPLPPHCPSHFPPKDRSSDHATPSRSTDRIVLRAVSPPRAARSTAPARDSRRCEKWKWMAPRPGRLWLEVRHSWAVWNWLHYAFVASFCEQLTSPQRARETNGGRHRGSFGPRGLRSDCCKLAWPWRTMTRRRQSATFWSNQFLRDATTKGKRNVRWKVDVWLLQTGKSSFEHSFNLVSTQTLWCIVRADAIEKLTVRNSFGENEVDTMEAVFMTIGLYEKKTMALFRNLWKKCITE